MIYLSHVAHTLLLLGWVAGSSRALAQIEVGGILDSSFDDDGIRFSPTPAASTSCQALAALPDGKTLAAGIAWSGGTSYQIVVTRLLEDGSTDTTFGDQGFGRIATSGSNLEVKRLTVDSSNRILIAVNTGSGALVVRFESDGSADTSWSIYYSSGVNMSLSDMAVRADGKVLLGGVRRRSATDTDLDAWVAQFLANGSLDLGYASSGLRLFSAPGAQTIRSMCYDSAADALWIAGGYAPDAASSSKAWVAKLGATGVVVPDGSDVKFFAGTGTSQEATHVVLDSLGRPLLAVVGGSKSVVRFRHGGILDLSFGVSGVVPIVNWWDPSYASMELTGLTIQSDGKIVLGSRHLGRTVNAFGAARLLPNGTLDPNFGSLGSIAISAGLGSSVYACCIVVDRADRALLAGGSVETGSFASRMTFLRLSSGSLEPPDPVMFSLQPEDVTAAVGTRITLTATASTNTAGSQIHYDWYRDGLLIQGQHEASIAFDLTLTSEGNYYAVADAGMSGATSRTAAIVAVSPPVITSVPSVPALVPQGGAPNLTVEATGRHPMTARLFLDDVEVASASKASDGDVFSFSASCPDIGQRSYRIVVSNDDGSADPLTGTITVTSNPYVGFVYDSMMVEVGLPAELPVQVVGSTGTVITTWRKDGKLLPQPPGEGLPILPQVSLADAGTYTLTLGTPFGIATSSPFRVCAYSPLSTSLFVKQGAKAVLIAPAVGPGMSFAWSKGGVPIASDSRWTGEMTRQLTITASSAADIGQYTCTVSDGRTSVDCGSIRLVVTSSAPTFTPISSLPDGTVAQQYASRLQFPDDAQSVKITGLPLGLQYDAATGRVFGTPRRSGTYSPRISFSNPSGVSPTQSISIVIAAIEPGLLGRHESTITLFPGIICPITVTVSDSGACTGVIDYCSLRGTRTLMPFKGQFSSESGVGDSYICGTSCKMPMRNALSRGALLLAWTKGGSMELDLDYQLKDTFNPDPIAYTDETTLNHVRLWAPGTFPPGWAGEYHLSYASSSGPESAPGGYSFLRFNVKDTGIADYSGKLADGTPLVGQVNLLANGTMQIHRWINAFRGEVYGEAALSVGTAPDFWDSRITSTLNWVRSGDATVRTTSPGDGFDVILSSDSDSGARYLPPNTTDLSGPLPLNVAPVVPNAIASYSDDVLPYGETYVTLTAKQTGLNYLDISSADSPHLELVSLSINPKTGLFTGKLRQVQFLEFDYPDGTYRVQKLTTHRAIQGLVVRAHNSLYSEARGYSLAPHSEQQYDPFKDSYRWKSFTLSYPVSIRPAP